jgi:hypothetical protein
MSDFNSPVFGTVNHSYMQEKEQYPAANLEALFDNAWANGVTAIVWNQYTPYFNDGETCVFSPSCEGVYSIQDISESTIERAPAYDIDDENDYDDDGEPTDNGPWLSANEYTYVRKASAKGYDYERVEIEQTKESLSVAAVKKAINSGNYNSVLLKNFGDHAKVVATPNGFYVEYFEHE